MMYFSIVYIILCMVLYLRNFQLISGGVVGLTKFFRKKGNIAWKQASQSKTVYVDHLCIDMNQLIHASVRSKHKPTLNRCIRRMYSELDNVLKYVTPTKSLVLVFDGPAPFAKLQTQRNRRSASPENNMITPGTDFMALMETFMLGYVFQRMNRFYKISVYISGANSPGEGEVKIIDWVSNYIGNKNESLVICGSDSDILLQAFILSKISDVSIFQRAKEYSVAFCNITAVIDSVAISANISRPVNSTNYKVYAPTMSPRDQYYENNPQAKSERDSYMAQLYSIKSYHTKMMHMRTHGNTSNTSTNIYNNISQEIWNPDDYLSSLPHSFNLDLLILFVMQGNDYLPKIRGITIEKTLLAYGTVMKLFPPERRYLLDMERNTFNFAALYLLMNELRCSSVQLHVQIPRPLHALNDLAQRKIIDSTMEWQDSIYEDPETKINTWCSSLCINNITFTTRRIYTSKSAARNALSIQILEQISPHTLKEMKLRRKKAQVLLSNFQNAVIAEECEQLNSLIELIPDMEQYRYLLEILSPHYYDIPSNTTNTSSSNSSSASVTQSLSSTNIDNDNSSSDDDDDDDDDDELDLMEDLEDLVEDDTNLVNNVNENNNDDDDDDDSEEDGTESNGLVDEEDNEDNEDLADENEAILQEDMRDDDNSSVTEEGYARYVRDSDVEEYLKGLLWVAQMYTDGYSSDVSYTYMGRPPVSPYLIINYISKLVWKNCLLAGIEDYDLPVTVQHMFRSLKGRHITRIKEIKQNQHQIQNQQKSNMAPSKFEKDNMTTNEGENNDYSEGLLIQDSESNNINMSTRQEIYTSTSPPSTTTSTTATASTTIETPTESEKQIKQRTQTQLKKLEKYILDNRIGVDIGGVSWQDIKTRIYVPISSYRPLSSDATCACLLPMDAATEDVPFHLRHIWEDMHLGFFQDLDEKGLQASTYHNLTTALQRVWNNHKHNKSTTSSSSGSGSGSGSGVELGISIDGSRSQGVLTQSAESSKVVIPINNTDTDISGSYIDISINNTTTLYTSPALSMNTIGTTNTLISTTSSSRDSDSDSNSNDVNEVVLLGRGRLPSTGSGRASTKLTTTQNGVQVIRTQESSINLFKVQDDSKNSSTMNNVVGLSATINKPIIINTSSSTIVSQRDVSSSVTSEYGNYVSVSKRNNSTSTTTASTNNIKATDISNKISNIDPLEIKRMMYPDVSYEISDRKKRVSGVFASPKDCHWTVITSNPLYTKCGLFDRIQVEMPLPIPFTTPKFLPKGCQVLRIPQTRVSPLRKFNYDEYPRTTFYDHIVESYQYTMNIRYDQNSNRHRYQKISTGTTTTTSTTSNNNNNNTVTSSTATTATTNAIPGYGSNNKYTGRNIASSTTTTTTSPPYIINKGTNMNTGSVSKSASYTTKTISGMNTVTTNNNNAASRGSSSNNNSGRGSSSSSGSSIASRGYSSSKGYQSKGFRPAIKPLPTDNTRNNNNSNKAKWSKMGTNITNTDINILKNVTVDPDDDDIL